MPPANAKLVSYEFNIRSFHPEKSFGWSGLNFSGDNRGFSLKPSGRQLVTSRIWHQFKLNAANGGILLPDTRSDDSKAAWSSKPFQYNDPTLKPRTLVFRFPPKKTTDGRIHSRARGEYHGSNHAMPGSPEMQKLLGTTYVPDINVEYEIFVTANAKESYIDVGILVKGDGFPNVSVHSKTSFSRALNHPIVHLHLIKSESRPCQLSTSATPAKNGNKSFSSFNRPASRVLRFAEHRIFLTPAFVSGSRLY